MRKVRLLGAESLREAEAAMKTVRAHRDEAQAIYYYMKAYHLLADYYERKVLAAVAALIHGFGGDASYRAEAERLADEAVERYQAAISFIGEAIDKKSGGMRGRWLGGKTFSLPQLIEREKDERNQLATLFHWPARDDGSGNKKSPATGPKAGTYVPEPARRPAPEPGS
jgi:hypothetical protein